MDIDHEVDIDGLSTKFQDMYVHDRFRSTFWNFITTATLILLIVIVSFILIWLLILYNVKLQVEISVIFRFLAMYIAIKNNIPYPNQIISPGKVSNLIRECTYLPLDSVNSFVNIANNDQEEYKLRFPTYFTEFPLAYSICAEYKRDDIQFIPTFINENEQQIGHLICCYYNATSKVVNVYDSLIHIYSELDKRNYKRRLEQNVFNELYPKHSYITFKTPKSVQPDLYSCVIYSMSYVTLLLQGLDPEKNQLNLTQFPTDPTMGIRARIIQMLQQNKLMSFSNQYFF